MALKDAGYGAIADLNDRKHSGYNAKTATIVFGGSAKISATKKIGQDVVEKTFKVENSKLNRQALIKGFAPYATAAVAANAAYKGSSITAENRYVALYRSQHPNSKLTREQILKTRK